MTKNLIHKLKRENSGSKYQIEDDDPDPNDPLRKFFIQMDELSAEIKALDKNVDQVKQLQSQIMSNPKVNKEAKKELDEYLAKIKKQLKSVRGKLKEYEESAAQEVTTGLVSDTTLRIRRTQFQQQTRAFTDVMTKFQEAQLTYRDQCKKRIKRELSIAGEDVDDERLEDLITSHDNQIFARVISNTQEAKQTLQDVEARHNDILKLEESIRELHDMFIEITNLVASQQDMVDRIENNVGTADVKVHDGVVKVKEAHENQKKVRKKKLYLAIAGTVVVVIVVIILAVSLAV